LSPPWGKGRRDKPGGSLTISYLAEGLSVDDNPQLTAERRPASPWAGPIGVFLGCLAVYLANGRAQAEVDCLAAPYAAWSLVRHGSLDLRPYPEMRPCLGLHVQQNADGSWVSQRPIGSTLAAFPFVAPVALFREQPPEPNVMMYLGKLAGAFAAAGAAAVFFVLCRRFAPGACVPATVLFALGTCLWSVASQALWTHGPAVFWVCCALALLLPPGGEVSGRRALAAGLALGLAVLTRQTTVFFALASGAALLLGRHWRAAAALALGGAGPAALLLLLNWSHFGHPTLGGYAADNWHDAPPWWLGLGGLLVAPSRGLLVYSPALLLAPLGLGALRRLPGCRLMLLAWTVAAAGTVVFYARWHDWRGGWCYGPRFLCEALPILCLLFALSYARLRVGWRRAAAGLVATSVLIHLAGVTGRSAHVAWQTRHEQPDQGRCLFEVRDTQIEAHARAALRKGLGLVGVR
jgi:hypothetical protein